MAKVYKRILIVMIVIALCVVLSVSLLSCAKNRLKISYDIDFDTAFNSYNKADGLSAYDVFIAAYNNYVNDRSYSFVEYFDFNAKIASGIEVATQQRKIVKKVDGNKIYENRVVVGTGAGEENKANKFYYDGTNAFEININDKKIVPNKGKGEEIFKVIDYANYSPFKGSASELETTIKEYREKICYYDFTKREYLSDNHDDNVYTKDNVYYLTISFDSTKEAMNSFNSASRDAFISSLGVADKDRDTLKLTEDSIYKMVIIKESGDYRIIGMQLIETYEGKAKGFTAKAQNKDTFIFDYTEKGYKINSDDIAGL